VLGERLKPTSQLKSVSCGNAFQIRSSLYAKKLKLVDEWHVGKAVYNRVRDELACMSYIRFTALLRFRCYKKKKQRTCRAITL